MFGLLQRSLSCALGAKLLAAVGTVCVAILEVEPREVLIHNSKQQEQRQDQHSSNVSTPSAVVKEALFSCLEVESDESRRRPRTEVVWMKDGEIIITKGNRKYRNFGKKKRLLISNPQAEDSGIYECATSPNSTERGRAELWIAPQVLSAPSPQTLQAWAGVGMVECQVGLGTQVIEWWLKGRQLVALNLTTGGSALDGNSTQQDSHYSILHNGSLILSSVLGADEGVYRCVASNKAGQHFKEIKVIVNDTDDAKEGEEIIRETTPTSLSTEDDDLTENSSQRTRDCIEYKDITFGPNPVFSTLPTPIANSSNSVSHSHPQPPYFTVLPPPCVQSLLGYRIVLNCSAGGSPRLNITWVKDGVELVLPRVQVLESRAVYQPHYVQMTDGSLLINPVQFEDRGKYVCRVSNGEGPAAEVSGEVRLRVIKTEEVCGGRSQGAGSGSASGQVEDREEEGRQNRRRRRKRVAYGEVVAGAHEWPWQALIDYRESESLCGGTLIRPDWVVTAAHCLYSSRLSSWISEGDLTVRMGVYNRSTVEYHQQQRQVRNYFVHPNYIPREFTSSKEHDIALLKLLHPVKLTSHVGPACLPPEYNDPPAGTLCTVTGWGHLEHKGLSPELLHKAQVPLVSYSNCRSPQSYGRSTSTVTRNMLCAGWREGGPDACQNDSGGPLVCPISSESPERWAVYGVVNWGDKCGLPHKYGVYARVTKYMRWINQKMKLH